MNEELKEAIAALREKIASADRHSAFGISVPTEPLRKATDAATSWASLAPLLRKALADSNNEEGPLGVLETYAIHNDADARQVLAWLRALLDGALPPVPTEGG